MNKGFKYYRINYQIASPTLRLLDEKGVQIGVVSKIEALQQAKEFGLDLVEIAPKAEPPVAKLIDYKKFKYQEAKRERESKKKSKNVDLKEVRLRPFIGQHDIDTRKQQASQWLDEGHQVKINVIFKGRENTRRQFGYDVLNKFMASLSDIKITRPAHMEGRVLSATVINNKK